MKYSEEIRQVSQQCGVDSALLASVANVESGFRSDAVSSKGAVGIMQIMPSTAKWVAQKYKKDFSEEKLKDEEFNIMLGGYYLSYLIDYFGDTKLGICAYNAGQGNVAKWLNDKDYSLDRKKLDKIPFEETRNYLNKVNKNYYYYKNRYK